MKFVAPMFLLVATVFLVGCPTPPRGKPPSGPPPEYEAPRAFELPNAASTDSPAAEPAPTLPADQPASPPPAETKPASPQTP